MSQPTRQTACFVIASFASMWSGGIVLAQVDPGASNNVLGWQVPPQVIFADDGHPTSGQGFASCMSMSPDGSVLVIGAANTSVDSLNGVGAVHLYERGPAGTWQWVQKITAPEDFTFGPEDATPPGFAQFGSSVAVDGKTLVVGAWGYAAFGDPVFGGKAFVFTRKDADGFWGKHPEDGSGMAVDTVLPDATLEASDAEMLDLFGFAVAVDVDGAGDGVVVVGKSLGGASNEGNAYVFNGVGGVWTQSQKLRRADSAISDQFGSKVAVSLPWIAVGVQNADTPNGFNSGSVCLFQGTDAGRGILQWPEVPTQELLPAAGRSGDGFGAALALSNSVLAAGAPGVDRDATGTTITDCGAVVMWTLVGDAWTEGPTLRAREPNQADATGYAVACSSGAATILVGAPGYEGGEVQSGTGFVFRRSIDGWVLDNEDMWSPMALRDQQFGRSVALSGDGRTAVLGSEYPNSEPSMAFGFQYSEVAEPDKGGELPDNAAPEPFSPGADGPEIGEDDPDDPGSGGGTPPSGGGSGTPVTTALTPLTESFGLVKFTIVSESDDAINLYGTQTDGQHTRNQPEPEFMGKSTEGWQLLGTPDINGDLGGDLIFFDPVTRKIWARLRDALHLDPAVTLEVLPAGYTYAAWGDFNDDGRDDLAFLKPGLLLIWSVNADGTITPEPEIAMPSGSWTATAADVDGNDSVDLMVRNRASATLLKVNIGNTDTPFTTLPDAGSDSQLASIADLDADGEPDEVWVKDDTLTFTFLEGAAAVESRPWTVDMDDYEVLAFRDFDNNGVGDPLLRNRSTDNLVVVLLEFQTPEELIAEIRPDDDDGPAGTGNTESPLAIADSAADGRLYTRGFVRVIARRSIGDLKGLRFKDISIR